MPARDFIFGRASCWNTFCDWLFCHADGHRRFVAGHYRRAGCGAGHYVLGGMLALMIKLLPWLLLAIAVVWVIKAIKAPKVPKYQRYDRWRY